MDAEGEKWGSGIAAMVRAQRERMLTTATTGCLPLVSQGPDSARYVAVAHVYECISQSTNQHMLKYT